LSIGADHDDTACHCQGWGRDTPREQLLTVVSSPDDPPPCKQWLAGMGVVSRVGQPVSSSPLSSSSLLSPTHSASRDLQRWWWWRHPCPPSRCRQSTHDPPHEQLLMRLGAGGVLRHQSSPCVIIIPVIEHPQSTLRAGACNGGGRWCALSLVLSLCHCHPLSS
jgi:hypothetical protein